MNSCVDTFNIYNHTAYSRKGCYKFPKEQVTALLYWFIS